MKWDGWELGTVANPQMTGPVAKDGVVLGYEMLSGFGLEAGWEALGK